MTEALNTPNKTQTIYQDNRHSNACHSAIYNHKESKTTLKIHLPHYQRFSKKFPAHLIELQKHDSLINDEEKQIEISPIFAWILLMINIFSVAMVPCWVLSNINYETLTKNSWRFLAISVLTLPFLMYERRQIAKIGGNIFDLLNVELIKQNFICSINICIWFLILKYACKFTSITHAVTLMSLKFFVSIFIKIVKQETHHQFESAGSILTIIGLLCMFYDSLTGQVIQGKYNQIYLSYSNLSRIFGDIIALSGSVISIYFDQKYQVPTQPRFLNVFLLNFFVGFNFISFGYFFGGSELSFDEYYGVFGVFDKQNFVNIFYISIMLGFNLILGNILINQIFSQFIIRIANCFVIILTSAFIHLLDLELTTAGLTYLSFGFTVPGLLLIMTGKNIMENNEININFTIYKPNIQDNNHSIKEHSIQFEMVQMNEKQSRLRFFSIHKVQCNELEDDKLAVSE